MTLQELVRPKLLSFDVFGTLVDWRTGLLDALKQYGVSVGEQDFDRIIGYQAELERGPFRTYTEVTVESLVRVAKLDRTTAETIAETLGFWPLFPDSSAALDRLRRCPVRLVAITNSDRKHGDQVQQQLGFRLDAWFCAEELGVYKPDLAVWRSVAERLGIVPSREWWHVSAYADYDLEAARRFGLTLVLVRRSHRCETAADLVVSDLNELADVVEHLFCAQEER